eukprot:6212031-Pleurochrysis_carterae.AAC.4
MDTSYRTGDSPIRSEIILDGVEARLRRPERAIMNVSSQLNIDIYRLNCGQGWEPHKVARLNRNVFVALSIAITSIESVRAEQL